jgi:hypothetical protein
MDPPATYKSYLLRLWTTTHDGETVWQGSTRNTATGERRGFPDLESLFDYLVAPEGGKETARDHKSLTDL